MLFVMRCIRLAGIIKILLTAAQNTIVFFSQDVLCLLGFLFPTIFLCITSCNKLYPSGFLNSCAKYDNFLVLIVLIIFSFFILMTYGYSAYPANP